MNKAHYSVKRLYQYLLQRLMVCVIACVAKVLMPDTRRSSQFICIFVIFSFLLNSLGPIPTAEAQELRLPVPGVMVQLSPEYNPPVLKGVTLHPDNPFKFDFILDKGDPSLSSPKASVGDLKQESTKLVKYFLAAITTPENNLWVNLSPYEKNRIIPNSFGQTDMGRDLLAEDYILKQITASLIYPEGETGRKFWKRVYSLAAKKYGTTNISVNTFNKVWIVPDHAKVYEHGNTAYIVKARLKVMLEEDYLSLEKHNMVLSSPKVSVGDLKQDKSRFQTKTFGNDNKGINALGSQVVREIVIPELEKEVNEGQNFAALRQVYNSLILAVWFKKRMKDSILGRKYMDQNKVNGIHYEHSVIKSSPVILSETKDLNKINSIKDSSASPQNDVEGIYQHYLRAFKKGVYNYIKEDPDPVTGEMIPRKYFSGGAQFNQAMRTTQVVNRVDNAEVVDDLLRKNDFATVVVNLANQAQALSHARLFHSLSQKIGTNVENADAIINRDRIYGRIAIVRLLIQQNRLDEAKAILTSERISLDQVAHQTKNLSQLESLFWLLRVWIMKEPEGLAPSILFSIITNSNTGYEIKGIALESALFIFNQANNSNIQDAARKKSMENLARNMSARIVKAISPVGLWEGTLGNMLNQKEMNNEEDFKKLELGLISFSKLGLPLAFLVIDRFSKNAEFLQWVVNNQKISPFVRLHALGRLFLLKPKLATLSSASKIDLNGIVDEIASWDQKKVEQMLASPMAKDHVAVCTLALVLWMQRGSSHYSELFSNKDNFINVMKAVIDSKLDRNKNNANFAWEFGTPLLKQLNGRDFLLIQIHELMHNILFMEFGLKYDNLNNLSIHEKMSDDLMDAIAKRKRWSTSSIRKILKYEKMHQIIESSNGKSNEEHVSARAQQVFIERAIERLPLGVAVRITPEAIFNAGIDVLNGKQPGVRTDFNRFTGEVIILLGERFLDRNTINTAKVRSRHLGNPKDKEIRLLNENDIFSIWNKPSKQSAQAAQASRAMNVGGVEKSRKIYNGRKELDHVEKFDKGILYMRLSKGEIDPREYYRELQKAIDPRVQVIQDVGIEYGHRAIEAFEAAGKQLKIDLVPLLVEPGISTRAGDFLDFIDKELKAGIGNNFDANQWRDHYAASLGSQTVFRGLRMLKAPSKNQDLLPELIEDVMRTVSLSDAIELRQGKDRKGLEKVLEAQLREGGKSKIAPDILNMQNLFSFFDDVESKLFYDLRGINILQSVSAKEQVSKYMTMKESEREGHAYIWKINIPTIYCIQWNERDFSRKKFPHYAKSILRTSDGNTYPLASADVESFVQVPIKSQWIESIEHYADTDKTYQIEYANPEGNLEKSKAMNVEIARLRKSALDLPYSDPWVVNSKVIRVAGGETLIQYLEKNVDFWEMIRELNVFASSNTHFKKGRLYHMLNYARDRRNSDAEALKIIQEQKFDWDKLINKNGFGRSLFTLDSYVRINEPLLEIDFLGNYLKDNKVSYFKHTLELFFNNIPLIDSLNAKEYWSVVDSDQKSRLRLYFYDLVLRYFDIDIVETGFEIQIKSNKPIEAIRIADRAQSAVMNAQKKILNKFLGPGGIDLTAKRMHLEVESDKAQVGQDLNLKAWEDIEIDGLYIKDIEITPMKNLAQLLGVHVN